MSRRRRLAIFAWPINPTISSVLYITVTVAFLGVTLSIYLDFGRYLFYDEGHNFVLEEPAIYS